MMSIHIFQTRVNTPIGCLVVHASESLLYGVELFVSHSQIDEHLEGSSIADKAAHQLSLYFLDAQFEWSLPLAVQGTAFQRKVWHYLQTIPVGETRTYSDVANELDSSARAVGNACKANPYAIVIPCHRVVSKTGLGGYYGKTNGNEIDAKQWLLDHESK